MEGGGNSVGLLGTRSSTPVCVGVSRTHLKLARRQQHGSERRQQRGEDALRAAPAPAAQPGWGRRGSKTPAAAVAGCRRPVLLLKMELFFLCSKRQSMGFKCYEGKRSPHLFYFNTDPLGCGVLLASPRCTHFPKHFRKRNTRAHTQTPQQPHLGEVPSF